MLQESIRTNPFETGGVLAGYWAEGGHEVVITKAIGPGPDAVRTRISFIPDHEYQREQVALHYKATGRREGYLGVSCAGFDGR